MATAHAKHRPPSSAHRWLPCPYSATVNPLYDDPDTEQSLKGDLWHEHMETRIVFGTLPVECDPDAADAMEDLADYVDKRFKELKAHAPVQPLVLVEQQLDIPETGEFGTADIVFVAWDTLEILDEKSGYVPVEVEQNDQMLTYLLGAIAKYGSRPKYRLGIHQPNFDHIDGPLRFWEPTDADVADFRIRVLDSIANPDRLAAGPHCKATYCDHRGACEAFERYARNDLALGWHTSELRGTDDQTLAKALDASDELAGWRTQLRSEAMRRIMNMDRRIHGYKVVKGRRNRAVRHPRELVEAVTAQLGIEWARRLFPDLVWVENLPVDREEVLKHLGTPKHIEDVLKQYARVHHLPKGAAKSLYANVVSEYIVETAGGLTLERAIDGRPSHRRGSEFGPINSDKLTIVL